MDKLEMLKREGENDMLVSPGLQWLRALFRESSYQAKFCVLPMAGETNFMSGLCGLC